MEGDKPDYFTFFFFSSAFQLQLDGANLLTQGVGTCAGREGQWEFTPNRTQHHLGPVPPKEGHVWVATWGQTGSDQFISVPLCSWTGSRGGPGTKKHLP